MDRVMQIEPHWKSAFTVWGNGWLNLNEARPDLIAAMLNIPATTAWSFTRHRDGVDGRPCTLDDVRRMSWRKSIPNSALQAVPSRTWKSSLVSMASLPALSASAASMTAHVVFL